jgi:hypothetical protein
MSFNRRVAVGVGLVVLLFGIAWVTRHRVIECDDWSCVVQNRWTGEIHRVSISETENLAEDPTVITPMDTTLSRSDTLVGNPRQVFEIYAFLDRCREAGVPGSACASMSADADVVRREGERDAEGAIGFENRRLVRLACITHDVDRAICWRWMPQ